MARRTKQIAGVTCALGIVGLWYNASNGYNCASIESYFAGASSSWVRLRI